MDLRANSLEAHPEPAAELGLNPSPSLFSASDLWPRASMAKRLECWGRPSTQAPHPAGDSHPGAPSWLARAAIFLALAPGPGAELDPSGSLPPSGQSLSRPGPRGPQNFHVCI